MSYSIQANKPTPDWLGYLLSILVILFICYTQCHSKQLMDAVEKKYINEELGEEFDSEAHKIYTNKGGFFVRDLQSPRTPFYFEKSKEESGQIILKSRPTIYIAEDFDFSIIYQGPSKEDAFKAFEELHPSFDKESVHHFITTV